MRNATIGDWALPAFSLALGALFFGAGIAGGHPAIAVASLAVMVVYAGMLVAFGARSDIVAVLRGQPPDERLAAFTLQATATAGTVALVVALASYVWSIARGGDGMAYIVVLAPAGLAFFASLLWQRTRG